MQIEGLGYSGVAQRPGQVATKGTIPDSGSQHRKVEVCLVQVICRRHEYRDGLDCVAITVGKVTLERRVRRLTDCASASSWPAARLPEKH